MADVLPFRLRVQGESRIDSTGVYDSSVRIHGLARLEGQALLLEWSGVVTHDEVGETIGTRIEDLPVRSARIPLESLAAVEFRRGWFRGPRVVLRAANLAAFSGIPGVKDGVLVLWLRRRDRYLGRDTAANLEIGLADAALLEAERGPSRPGSSKTLPLLASLAILGIAPVSAQAPVGAIDFYGVRSVPVATLRAVLQVKEGDSVTSAVLEEVGRLEAVPGVRRAAVDAVCCEEGRTTIYIGIEEDGASAPAFRPAPSGPMELPGEIVRAYDAFESAFAEAIRAGDFAEDDSQGHALMHFPAAREAQERFVGLAARHGPVLKDVLRQSGNQQHRAIAAQVLAYSPDKRDIVEPLVFATRDPYSTVRNNAVRALALIAGFARRYPDRNIAVPAEPLVDLLNSLVWTDRNKSSLALMQISETRDPALLALLKAQALPSLVEMARWKAPGHAVAAVFLLGRIAGMTDAGIFAAWESDRRETIIEAARQ